MIWRRQLHVTVKHLLSDLTDIRIVHLLSITSPFPCPLALSSWEEWTIWWRRSHVTVKHLLSDPTDVRIIQQPCRCLVHSLWAVGKNGGFGGGGVACLRQALALLPYGHPDRSMSLNNLAGALSVHFGQLARMEDLEEAIICLRQALTLLPHGHPNRSSSLNYLAFTRFEHLGRMEDFEEAITYCRQALGLRPHGHPGRPSSLDNLTTAMTDRFEQLG